MVALRWKTRILAGYAAWMTLLIATYYLFAGLRLVTWGLIGCSGVVAIVAGVIMNRPMHRTPWLLLAAANLSFAIGQMSFLVITRALHETVPFPSVLDGFYLATYPFQAGGLLIFIRWRTGGRDRRSLLDALTLTVGLGLLSWLYLILPYARNPDLTWVQKAFTIAYPLGDVLVLAMLARLLAPGSRSTRPVQLLAAGSIGGLASDVSFGLIQLHGTFSNGTIVDLGWAVFYGAWGAAALHPSMADLTQPVPRQAAETTLPRLILLMLASLIAPGVLLIDSIRGHHTDASVIAVFSAILYLLVLSRLADVAASHRRALSRERVLRVAGASLASAVTVEEVAGTLRRVVATLASPHPQREPSLAAEDDETLRAAGAEALLAVRDDDSLRAVGWAPGEPHISLAQLDSLVGSWLPLIAGSGPRLVPAAPPGEHTAGETAGSDSVLVYPLTLADRPSGDPLIGVMAVFGAERTVAALAGALEILASQVALAVERVMLSQEINRRNSEAYFRSLVQDASDIILIVKNDGAIQYATPSAASLFGDSAVEGGQLQDLAVPSERDDLDRSFRRMRDGSSERAHEDWEFTRRDGAHIEVEVRYSDLRHDPTVAGLVLTLRDITEQRKLERELKYRAFHDTLTGLPNRLLFQDRLGHALARAHRNRSTVGVLFVDLDDFKIVNDTMGHGVGDDLLRAAAARLAALVRESDTTARLGGDEFAILMEDARDSAAIESFAERIVRAFGEPFLLIAGSLITTATVGIATTEDGGDAGDLIRHADLALYAAKSAGKRQWRRYQPVLSVGLTKRREMQAAIDDAVARSAFTLVYQPIVALASGEVAGFEALTRWPHPEWGMIPPEEFIAVAEQTGHIVPLGSWVLRQAAADTVRWQERAPRRHPLYVSVNVSARQFRDPGFVADVRRSLAQSGLAPSSLLLELTESAFLQRDDRIRSDLTELKRLGVRLAIDDFGTGYSSLGYLREFPVDVLKIDRSFVEGMSVSQQRLALVEVIIRIAKTLGLTVMAEGIESEEQRDLLISLGCEFGQGYLLERPLGAEEAEALALVGSIAELHAVSRRAARSAVGGLTARPAVTEPPGPGGRRLAHGWNTAGPGLSDKAPRTARRGPGTAGTAQAAGDPRPSAGPRRARLAGDRSEDPGGDRGRPPRAPRRSGTRPGRCWEAAASRRRPGSPAAAAQGSASGPPLAARPSRTRGIASPRSTPAKPRGGRRRRWFPASGTPWRR